MKMLSAAQTVGLAVCFCFSLFPVQAEKVVIGALGDFGSSWKVATHLDTNELAVANVIKSWNPDFIVTLGDNNYPEGEWQSMDINIGQFFHGYIDPYVGSFGEGAVSNRFWPSLGNHDWGFPVQTLAGIEPHLDYFVLPGNERYYHFRYGPVEMFALSSDDAEPDGNTFDSVQGQWLQAALAASTAPWKIVYLHDSPYSSGQLHGTWRNESEGVKVKWPYQAWGASLVLSAHDHLYERILRDGFPYVVCGSGGDRLDDVHYPLVAGSQTNITDVYGALRLDVTESNLFVRFINVEGVVMDTYGMGDLGMPPEIVAQPVDQEVPAGGEARFEVSADGSAPLGYQWYFQGAGALPNETNATLILSQVQTSQAGAYYAVVTNLYGSATSDSATLIVRAAPVITLQPQSSEVLAGASAALSVEVQGQPPFRYQWHFEPTGPLPGATQADLMLPSVQWAEAGNYFVVVENDFGSATSLRATVSLAGSLGESLDQTALIWSSPEPAWFGQIWTTQDGVDAAQTAPIGDGQTNLIQAVLRGPGVLRFWWKVSSQAGADVLSFSGSGDLTAAISGEVDWREEVFYVPSLRVGRWQYVKDANGQAGTDAGWLDRVSFVAGQAAPIITRQPQDLAVEMGATATLQAAVVGTPPLACQWYFNGLVPVPQATNAILSLVNVQPVQSGPYHLVVTNALGRADSTPALLTVIEPFRIQPLPIDDDIVLISVSGVPGSGLCLIQTSSDLNDWISVYTNTTGESAFTYPDTVGPEDTVRFYRAVVP